MNARPFSRAICFSTKRFVAPLWCLAKLQGGVKLHRLLLGEGVRGPRARGLEARVGVHGLIRWGLLIGVLWQEGDGRVGRSGLGLGEAFRVADTLVAHVFGRVQHPLWTPPGVL